VVICGGVVLPGSQLNPMVIGKGFWPPDDPDPPLELDALDPLLDPDPLELEPLELPDPLELPLLDPEPELEPDPLLELLPELDELLELAVIFATVVQDGSAAGGTTANTLPVAGSVPSATDGPVLLSVGQQFSGAPAGHCMTSVVGVGVTCAPTELATVAPDT
jgi:hypothetical protein